MPVLATIALSPVGLSAAFAAGVITLRTESQRLIAFVPRGDAHTPPTTWPSLFDVLERELAEGRKYYERKLGPAVLAQTDYFDRAAVDILVKGQGGVESKIW